MRNSLYSCIFLFPDILRSCDGKLVFRFWARARCGGKAKMKGKCFVCGGLGNFPKKSFAQRNCPEFLSLHQKIRYSFFKALSMIKVFSLTIHASSQPNRSTHGWQQIIMATRRNAAGTNMQRTSKPSRDRVAIFQATSFHRNNRSQLPSVMDRLELQRCAFLQT